MKSKPTIKQLAGTYVSILAQCGWDVCEMKIYDDHPDDVAEKIVECMQSDGAHMD